MGKRKKISNAAHHLSWKEFDLRSEAKNQLLASALKKLTPHFETNNSRVEWLYLGSFEPPAEPQNFISAIEIYNSFFFDMVDETMHEHIGVFDQFQNDRIIELNSELKKLQEELKNNRNYQLVARIKSIIANIKDLAYRYISLKQQQIRIAKQKLTSSFSRNLKLQFRKLVQFKFKNLDDESHSEVVAKKKTTNYFIVKNIHHDFQRKGYYQFERSNIC